MKMRFLLVLLVILLKGSLLYSIDCNPPDCTKVELKRGIIWYHKVYSNLLGGPQDVNILDIDNNDPHIYIKPVYKSSSSCERTSSMGSRTSAIAGINGGFFDSSNGCVPVGLLKIDNKVISYAVSYRPPRSALGIGFDKTILFRRTDSKDSFPEALHALGGMPNLVKDGKKYVTTSEEQADSIAGINPRTAICKTGSNHFLMITVDGRASGRTGMTLDDLAQYLLWLGCTDGINLDGGGSTTMWISTNGVVNHPSDGRERYVSNGLFVYYSENTPPVIVHQPVNESYMTDIVISAVVSDDTQLKAVNLKFKNITDSNFTSRPMMNKGNDIYEAVISRDEIKSDTIQYYIAAWDGELRTTYPIDAEYNNHYIAIKIIGELDGGYDIISEDSGAGTDIYPEDYISYDIVDATTLEDSNENVEDVISADVPSEDLIVYDAIYGDGGTVDSNSEDTSMDIIGDVPQDSSMDTTDTYLVTDAVSYEDTVNLERDVLSEDLAGLSDGKKEVVSSEESAGCSCTYIM